MNEPLIRLFSYLEDIDKIIFDKATIMNIMGVMREIHDNNIDIDKELFPYFESRPHTVQLIKSLYNILYK